MPKRASGKGGRPWNQTSNDQFLRRDVKYGEHDDRNDTRHVSFKPNNRQGKNKFRIRDWETSIRSHLQDEDIDMGALAGSSTNRFTTVNKGRRGRYSPGPRGGGSGGGGGQNSKPKLLPSPSNWYKVIIPYGRKYEKDYVAKILQTNIAPDILIPIQYCVNGNEATFFVDNFKVANKLFNADRQIRTQDGFKLIIKVRNGLPQIDINATLKEKMKSAMAKRYNPATKALDLTKFHIDPELTDYFCALYRPTIMLAVIDIIAENIPDLQAVNFEDNSLHVIEHMSALKKKLPFLTILHLRNNRIRDVRSLDTLKGLNILDLVLDGNPLCDKFKDQTSYVSEVRKRFPKLLKLDGVDLDPPIVFDVAADLELPPSQQTFLCSSEGQEIVRQFLEQYFIIYDSDNRQPLLQAYHEHAMFSMTMGYPFGQNQKNSPGLNWYTSDNRNLLRLQDTDRRRKLLKQGQLSVVSYLSELPKTKHDIHSFKVDLTLFTPQLLLLSVTGIFKEIGSGLKVPPIRAFNRVLVIIPAGSGFCIANEELFITNATNEQEKEAFKVPVVLSPPAAAPVVTPVSPVVAVPTAVDDHTKQQMVQTLAQQSTMNIEWSTKCLEETNWDFQRALFVFSELQKQGSIPPEAFVK